MLDQNLVLKSNELFTSAATETDSSRELANGLYLRDTRHLSILSLTLGGARLERLAIVQDGMTSSTIVSSNPWLELENSEGLRPQSLLVTKVITLTDKLNVTIAIHNLTGRSVVVPAAIQAGADFRDLFDIRGFARADRGVLLDPVFESDKVRFSYRGLDEEIAATEITFDRTATMQLGIEPNLPINHNLTHLPASRRERERQATTGVPNVTANWVVELRAGETWRLELAARFTSADNRPVTADSPNWPVAPILGQGAVTDAIVARSIADLAALDTTFADGALVAAGIPWFVAPFGRDSLIAALQTLHTTPQRAVATLRTLAKLQGTVVDPRKEEEPGKIPHEMRYGEMARLKEVPHSPYYGTADATPLWIWVFAETVAWTLDRSLYDQLLPQARAAITWCQQYGDLDGDGLIEYRMDHDGPGAISHQVWKDSHDSLHFPDGTIPTGPIAPVEVQGYAFAGLTKLAECARHFDDPQWAAELDQAADLIRQSVESSFWIEADNCYAQALDGGKHAIGAINSNAGHLLAVGLPALDRANRLIDRLVEPDMLTHWGLRTLSSSDRSYSPISYHNGSIWPHDNSLVGYGCYRYGRHDAGDRILAALLAAALAIPNRRLPELYCGFDADGLASVSPIPYPVSCSPQAWAAGAIPFLLRGKLHGDRAQVL
jgi:glycogen debranching enzyme